MKRRLHLKPFAFLLACALFLARTNAFGDANTCFENALLASHLNSFGSLTHRSFRKMPTLKIATYNVLNFYDNVGEWKYVGPGNRALVKPPEPIDEAKLDAQAKVILEMDADVLMLQEVIGGLPTLVRFNEQKLGGKYSPYLVVGNDTRGINEGLYIKNDVDVHVKIDTHRDEVFQDPASEGAEERLFSRDVLAVEIRLPGTPDESPPVLMFLLVHGKSMRDRPGDPGSVILAKGQLQGLAEIYGEYRARYGPKVPIITGGDFNRSMEDPMIRAFLEKTRQIEALVSAGVPPKERVTHTFHSGSRPPDTQQMDAFFVNAEMKKLIVKAGVYRYKDENGNPKLYRSSTGGMEIVPQTYDQRATNPSDHFPAWMIWDLQETFKTQGL